MEDVKASQLYEQYGSLIFRRCRTILQDADDAWDATQEVFLKLLDYKPKSEQESLLPWIYSVSRNYCFNLLRSRKKFNTAVQLEDIPEATDSAELRDQQALIKLCFSLRDKRVQQAAYYTYVEELDQNEIGRVTGQSPATIRRNLARFREWVLVLRKRLAYE